MKSRPNVPARNRLGKPTPFKDLVPGKQDNIRRQKTCNLDMVMEAWNTFNKRSGSFADKHSTL